MESPNRSILLLTCRLAVLSLSLACLVTGARGADDKQTPDAHIARLIAQLESPRFRERQQATRELLKVGSPAIRPLFERAKTGRLEVAVRAIAVFEAAYTGSDAEGIKAASTALEALAISPQNDLAEHARAVLERNQPLRTQLAVKELRALGGVIENYDPEPLVRSPRIQLGQNGSSDAPWLVLDAGWKGGTEGLAYVLRLKGTPFHIYIIDGVPLDEKAINSVASEFDEAVVVRRGSAMLGVSGISNGGGCYVTGVVRGTGAWTAGIREGDMILKFDGEDILDFSELVERLKQQKAGDIITLTVASENDPTNTPVDRKVKLGLWRPPVSKPARPLGPAAKPPAANPPGP